VFPADIAHFYYRTGGDDNTLWLIDPSNQQQAIYQMRNAQTLTGVFDGVREAQVCSRQMVVSFGSQKPSDSPDTLTLKKTLTLKDGRTASVYLNQCHAGPEALLRFVDGMQSF